MAARYANDIQIAEAQRDYELKKASFDQEVLTKKAQSELAYQLQVFFSAFVLCYVIKMVPSEVTATYIRSILVSLLYEWTLIWHSVILGFCKQVPVVSCNSSLLWQTLSLLPALVSLCKSSVV